VWRNASASCSATTGWQGDQLQKHIFLEVSHSSLSFI
jgi:hypothetical protein